MTMKEQLHKLKENWLLVGIVLVVLLFSQVGSGIIPQTANYIYDESYADSRAGGYGAESAKMAVEGSYIPAPYAQDFAPDVAERQITKTASISTEVEHGRFWEAQTKLESVVSSTDSYLLQQNVNKYDVGRKSYYYGNYQIKV